MPPPEQEPDGIEGVKRKAVNYPIQGSAAEITQRAMELVKHLDMPLQLHDEIILEGEYSREYLVGLGLEDAVAPFHCPIDVEVMHRWH